MIAPFDGMGRVRYEDRADCKCLFTDFSAILRLIRENIFQKSERIHRFWY